MERTETTCEMTARVMGNTKFHGAKCLCSDCAKKIAANGIVLPAETVADNPYAKILLAGFGL